MASDMPALELDGVTKRYGETIGVTECSLQIQEGEFFTLVGPSGCGKTTTLRLIAGLEEPDAGTITIDGSDMTGVPPEDRDIGIVFQDYALFPSMTVGENVGYGLRFTELPADTTRAERVQEMLELVDLSGFEARSPSALSGGQRQRVALARALAPNPSILLLDEPLSALDAQLRSELRRQIRRIQQMLDITTVYVTHDQSEALAISDRVAVFNAGHPEQIGTPQAIYAEPETPFVARFIGNNAVLTGTVTDGHEDAVDGTPPTAGITLDTVEATIAVDSNQSLTHGTPVTAVIPATAFTIDSSANRFEGTVETCEFLGDRYRARVDWNGLTIPVQTPRPIAGSVTLGFEPTAVHLIPDAP